LDSAGVEAGVPGPGSYDADKVYGLGACKIRHFARTPGFFGGRNATKMGSTKVKMLVLRRKIKDDLLGCPGPRWRFFYHQFIDG